MWPQKQRSKTYLNLFGNFEKFKYKFGMNKVYIILYTINYLKNIHF